MSACNAQEFDNVSQSAWACIVQKAEGYGISVSGDSGEATKNGFTVTWNYDPAAQTLQLQCVNSPLLVPCSIINAKIQELVNRCL
jgi:nitrate reductase cytochrome c-type subunit